MDICQSGVSQFPTSIQCQIRESGPAESGAKNGNWANEVVIRAQQNAGSPLLTGQLVEERFIDRMVDSETMNRECVPGNCL